MTTKKKSTTNNQHLELQTQINSLRDQLARSLADYSNLEKRVDSQRQLIATLASATIVTKMVEVLDDLYLAQDHLRNPGLQIAVDKLLNILKSEGLVEINAINQPFDPETMDCVEVSIGPQDQVTEVKKKGYLLNNHCLRPAKVVVGKEDAPNKKL